MTLDHQTIEDLKDYVGIDREASFIQEVVSAMETRRNGTDAASELNALANSDSRLDQLAALKVVNDYIEHEVDTNVFNMHYVIEDDKEYLLREYDNLEDLYQGGFIESNYEAIVSDWASELYVEINESENWLDIDNANDSVKSYIDEVSDWTEGEIAEWMEEHKDSTELKQIRNELTYPEGLSDFSELYAASRAYDENMRSSDDLYESAMLDTSPERAPSHWYEWREDWMRQAYLDNNHLLQLDSPDEYLQLDDCAYNLSDIKSINIKNAVADTLIEMIENLDPETLQEALGADYERWEKAIPVLETLSVDARRDYINNMTAIESLDHDEAFELPADLIPSSVSGNVDYETELTKAHQVAMSQKDQDRDR